MITEYSRFYYYIIAWSKIRAWGIGHILANFGFKDFSEITRIAVVQYEKNGNSC